MKYLLISILFSIASCSHYHQGGHQHDKSDSDLSHKHAEFKVEHADKDYYFKTELERDAFLKSIADEKVRSRSNVRARGRRF